jgi:hypothetical protein
MLDIKYILLSLVFWPLVSMSADKHVHGEAELFIAIEGNQVLLEFQSPADNIIGFEHAPTTQSQHTQLENSLAKLGVHTYIATFSGAVCQQLSAVVESPFKDHHKAATHNDSQDSAHKKHGHDNDKHNHEKDNHTDFYASYTLQCNADIDNISAIKINAFKHFTSIKNINIKWITPKGQGSIKALPNNKEVILK